MLSGGKRLLSALLSTVLGVGLTAWAVPAIATDPPPGFRKVCDHSSGECWFIAESEVRDEPAEPQDGKPAATSQVKTCNFDGAPQKCTDDELGNWSNTHQCYLKPMVPPPPYDDPIWTGKTNGAVWACLREQGYDEGRHLVTRFIWIPGEPDTVIVDPLTLVYRAIAEMKLGKPQIQTTPGPGQIGLVNMPVWLWLTKSENTWGPITRSASVPGLTVNVKAQVKAVNWSLGDGKTLRCETAGTPYTKSSGIKDSPDCGHRYTKTSRTQPNCNYPITATTHWDITWESTLGDDGQIPMTQSANTQLRIGEAVPVLVDPDGSEATQSTTKVSSC